LDEYDIATYGSFEGVLFRLHSGADVVINHEELYYYLNIACEHHIKYSPQDDRRNKRNFAKSKTKIQSLIGNFRIAPEYCWFVKSQEKKTM